MTDEKTKKTREVAVQITRGLIKEDVYNSDPIYAKIDEWYKEGVPDDKIKERVKNYMDKKENNNGD